jgi:hypothetical protein
MTMTRKITEPQRQLLERAAGEPITDAAAVDAGVSHALIHKNLIIWLPAQGEGSRLIVTQQGLAALAAVNARRAATAVEDAGACPPRADVAHARRLAKIGEPIGDAMADAGPTSVALSASLPGGKLGVLAALLQRAEGACVGEMMAATGWQAHSVRGAMSGGLKKKLGLVIESEKAAAGRVYRIVGGEAASLDPSGRGP